MREKLAGNMTEVGDQSLGPEPSWIEFHGHPGSSQDCEDAVVRLLQCDASLSHARILTCNNVHSFLLTTSVGDSIAIKSGFSSGYGGAGPSALSLVLALFLLHEIEIDEVEVSESVLDAIDQASLSISQLELIRSSSKLLPSRWSEYIHQEDCNRPQDISLWRRLSPIMPYAIIDVRLLDLAISFKKDPDAALMKGYKRLEDIVRKRTGLEDSGSKLFSRAFQGEVPKLSWQGIDKTEVIGRANLFSSIYMAYRNPRAHREMASHNTLSEFLLLNELFELEQVAL